MRVRNRKQKEIADRHAAFLDIAYSIFVSEGYQQLSMNKIAEIGEYSKGTVYQHFHCKEEVLIQLCNQCMVELSGLFTRAGQFAGTHRERMVALFFAKELWGTLKPKNHKLLQALCADGIRDKVSPDSLRTHYALETGLFEEVTGIVKDALASGDLPPLKHTDPFELVFGLWSLGFGGQLLISMDLPLQRLGIRNAQNALFTTMSAILDGLGWQPLTSRFDYYATRHRIGEEVFSAELEQIRRALKDSTKRSSVESSVHFRPATNE